MTIPIIAPERGFPLTYPGHVPASALLDRVLGPDWAGGLYRVVEVEHFVVQPPEMPRPATRAWVKGITPAELRRCYRDDFGQVWLRPEEKARLEALRDG